jgi:hypothetical protein
MICNRLNISKKQLYYSIINKTIELSISENKRACIYFQINELNDSNDSNDL